MTATMLDLSRLPALDGLRAVAVLLVFAVHVTPDRVPGGFIGVDVFFSLSGYLITALLLAELERTGRVSLSSFYSRRARRLAPALVVLAGVVTPVMAVLDLGRPVLDGLAAVLYLGDVWAPVSDTIGGGFAHTWSLAVEQQFYLVWPLALLVLQRRGRWVGVAVVGAASACSVATVLVLPWVGPSALYRSPLPHVAELAAGALLALALADPRGRRRLSWLRRPAVPVTGLAALGVLALVLPHEASWLYDGGFALLGLGCAALVGALVLAPGGTAARALSWRPAVWLGVRSYGFYLWHYPVVLTLDQAGLGRALTGVVALGTTLALAALSWSLVEQPFLRRRPGHGGAGLAPRPRLPEPADAGTLAPR